MENALPPLNDVMVGRHFAHVAIYWKVHDISVALCNRCMQLHSVEFTLTGPVETNWKMSLDISTENDLITLYLEMLPCKIEKLRVKVNRIVYVLDSWQGNIPMAKERAFTFEPGYKLPIEVFQLWSVLKRLSHQDQDVLRVRCAILVQFGYNPSFPKPADHGITTLSYDLSQLLKERFYTDVKLQVANCLIPSHRALLGYRSEHLASMMQLTGQLQFNDYNAVDALFSYMYTGDLSFVLSNPSIRICEYIERLRIPELKNLYHVEEMKLESGFKVYESVFEWILRDFRNIREPQISPPLRKEGTEAVWQLHLYPRGRPGANEYQQNYLYVEAELLESSKPLDVCIEFSSLNYKEKIMQIRRTHSRMNVRNKVGLDFFRLRELKMEQSLGDNSLYIRFTVRSADTGKTFSVLSEYHPPSFISIDNERTYRILSQRMGDLLASHDYSDLTLQVDGTSFKVHRFLLATRSPIFKGFLEGSTDKFEEVLSVPSVGRDIFRLFLVFLYTGIIRVVDRDVLIQLYDMSIRFCVDSLKRGCLQFLAGHVNTRSLLKDLLWSENKGEYVLKTWILQLIASSHDAVSIHSHPDWGFLATEKPELCNDILVFMLLDSNNRSNR